MSDLQKQRRMMEGLSGFSWNARDIALQVFDAAARLSFPPHYFLPGSSSSTALGTATTSCLFRQGDVQCLRSRVNTLHLPPGHAYRREGGLLIDLRTGEPWRPGDPVQPDPIIVDPSTNEIIDGAHRAAALQAGYMTPPSTPITMPPSRPNPSKDEESSFFDRRGHLPRPTGHGIAWALNLALTCVALWLATHGGRM